MGRAVQRERDRGASERVKAESRAEIRDNREARHRAIFCLNEDSADCGKFVPHT